MATRHQVRQGVVSLLYSYEIAGENSEFLNEFLEQKKIRNRQKDFTLELFDGINSNLESIDNELNLYLNEYKINEIGSVERAILRLGVYEINFTKTDNAVIINEAIELAKEMASDSSPKFVNGVLDAVCKKDKQGDFICDKEQKSGKNLDNFYANLEFLKQQELEKEQKEAEILARKEKREFFKTLNESKENSKDDKSNKEFKKDKSSSEKRNYKSSFKIEKSSSNDKKLKPSKTNFSKKNSDKNSNLKDKNKNFKKSKFTNSTDKKSSFRKIGEKKGFKNRDIKPSKGES